MASYVLFVTGRYDLSNKIFPTLRDTADVMKETLGPNPVDFTIQCFDKDGRFARAFGGIITEDKVRYNGWTTDNRRALRDMAYLMGRLNLETGLEPEDDRVLNNIGLKSVNKWRRIIAEMRLKYAGDGVAFQQIDQYDPESPFRPHISAYRDALRNGDGQAEKRETAWLRKRYPHVFR